MAEQYPLFADLHNEDHPTSAELARGDCREAPSCRGAATATVDDLRVDSTERVAAAVWNVILSVWPAL